MSGIRRRYMLEVLGNSVLFAIPLCLAGGLLFAVGLGAVSRIILNKTSLV